MIVVKDTLCNSSPHLIPEIYQLFKDAKGSDSLPHGAMNAHPMGIQEVSPHLEFVIDLVHQQGLTHNRATLKSLIHPLAWLD